MSPVIAHTLEALLVIAGALGSAFVIARAMDAVTARERAGCPHCRRIG